MQIDPPISNRLSLSNDYRGTVQKCDAVGRNERNVTWNIPRICYDQKELLRVEKHT